MRHCWAVGLVLWACCGPRLGAGNPLVSVELEQAGAGIQLRTTQRRRLVVRSVPANQGTSTSNSAALHVDGDVIATSNLTSPTVNALWEPVELPTGAVATVERRRTSELPLPQHQIGQVASSGFAEDEDGVYFASHSFEPLQVYSASGVRVGSMTASFIDLTYATVHSDGRLYVPAVHNVFGNELFVWDPRTNQTQLVADVNPGPGGSSSPQHLASTSHGLYFSAYDPDHGRSLWLFNPDSWPTPRLMAYSTTPGDSLVSCCITPFGEDAIVLVGHHNPSTRLLYVFNSTTRAVQRMLPQSQASQNTPTPTSPSDLFAFGSGRFLAFSAVDDRGREPWLWDSEAQDMDLITDLYLGSGASSNPADFVVLGEYLVFSAQNEHGRSLFRYKWSDGLTSANVANLANLDPQENNPAPQDLTAVPVAGVVFFTAETAAHGRELWSLDPSLGFAQLLWDVVPGSNSSSPSDLTAFAGGVVFVASVAASDGRQLLWARDASDKRVLNPAGGRVTQPMHLVASDSFLHLVALNAAGARRFFVLDSSLVLEAVRTQDAEPLSTDSFSWAVQRPDGTPLTLVKNAARTWLRRLDPQTMQVTEIPRPAETADLTTLSVRGPVALGSTPRREVVFATRPPGPFGSQLWAMQPGKMPRLLGSTQRASILYLTAAGTDACYANQTVLWCYRGAEERLYRAEATPQLVVPSTGSLQLMVSFEGDVYALASREGESEQKLVRIELSSTPSGPPPARVVRLERSWLLSLQMASIMSGPSGVVFVALDRASGARQVYVYHPTNGSRVLLELGGQVAASQPYLLACLHSGHVLFAASDSVHGMEPWLWSPNGHARLVADFAPGARGSSMSAAPVGRDGALLAVYNGITSGRQLWEVWAGAMDSMRHRSDEGVSVRLFSLPDSQRAVRELIHPQGGFYLAVDA